MSLPVPILTHSRLTSKKGIFRIVVFLMLVMGILASMVGYGRAWQPASDISQPQGQEQEPRPQDVNGPQHWATLMCKFADVAAEPQNAAFFEGMFARTQGPSLADFWREVSYDNIPDVTTDAYGWFTLPNGRSDYDYSDTTPGFSVTAIVQDCVDAADSAVDFSGYDAVAVMLNSPSPVAITTLFPINYPDGAQISLGAIAIPSNKYNLALVAHEMGHAYGLPHSFANGEVYKNPWDLMGISSGYRCSVNQDPTYGCLGQHPISIYKDRLGWIPDAQIFEAPAGESAITLERLAQPQSDNYLMATIATGNTQYVVEARQRVGYDAKLAGDAVIIHLNDDLRDADGSPYDDAGAMWLPGETFTDDGRDISVRVDAATATGFTITINNGESAVTGEMVANLQASPVTPDPGEQVDFQAFIHYEIPDFSNAQNVAMTITIPAQMSYVAGSLSAPSATVISEDPIVLEKEELGAGGLLISYAATVNEDVTSPTAIDVPIEVSWDGGATTFYHRLVASGETVYLPAVIR